MKIVLRKIKKNIRLCHYKIGETLADLRKKCKTQKEFNIRINSVCNYKISYVYFLIDLYKTCNTYNDLRYTTLPISILRKHFNDLKILMENDKTFWQSSIQHTPMVS